MQIDGFQFKVSLRLKDWGEQYTSTLREAGLVFTLFKIYVDDVRQVSTVLAEGTRFCLKTGKMEFSKVAAEEDARERESGESEDARMARILLPAMNSINPDLRFTAEVCDDFEDNCLPTLDFKLWLEGEEQLINHTYFEKEMRSQLMIPEQRDKRSA